MQKGVPSAKASAVHNFYKYFFREWNHREQQWYYHDLPNTNIVHNGYTGSSIVVLLIILLWLYSLYRLWIVCVNTLNFDGVPSIPTVKGWDFVSWMSNNVRRRKREGVEEAEGGTETVEHFVVVNRNDTTSSIITEADTDMNHQMKHMDADKEHTNKRIIENRLELSLLRQNIKITTDI